MFEWDTDKARTSQRKHGVAFADTFAVFDDPRALTLDQRVHGELRHVTIGLDCFARILVVAYTWRGDKIRIITARKATKREIRQYED